MTKPKSSFGQSDVVKLSDEDATTALVERAFFVADPRALPGVQPARQASWRRLVDFRKYER